MTWTWRDGRPAASGPLLETARSGQGFFTTAGATGGRPLLWSWHRERLVATGRLLAAGADLVLPGEEELSDLLARCALPGPARVRLVVWRLQDDPRWRVEASAVAWHGGGPGAAPQRLAVVRSDPGRLTGHKTLARQELDGARREAQRAGADDALLVDSEGRARETAVANLWAVLGNRLVTPPAPGRCLPGVMRRWLLEGAAAAGLEAVERDIDLAELGTADEVWVTNALVGVRRVDAVGERRWRGGKAWQRVAALGVPAPEW